MFFGSQRRLRLRPGAAEAVAAARRARRPAAGHRTARCRARAGMRLVLAVSIVTNLGLLAVFKYTGFVAENVNAMAALLGVGDDLVPVLHLVLPVGISFYTFKAMSYVIDVYRGDARPMRRFTDYMCFEAFFPDLVAGPIIRYAALEEQMRVRQHTARQVRARRGLLRPRDGQEDPDRQPDGAHRRHARSPPGRCTRRTPGSACVGYAFQIYFDFSGYSDMAVGLALMMGFVLIQNFDSPYQADSITDFWRRWHISLSTWLRDYLYIPLGGNRKGPAPHLRQPDDGHAAGRAVARGQLELRDLGRHPRRHAGGRARAGQSTAPTAGCPAPVRVAITFFIVCLSWVFFRAKTLRAGARPTSRRCSALADAGRRGRRRRRRALHALPRRACSALAALLVWGMPNTWAFTARLTLAARGRAAWRCWRCRSC